jgi:hypothetical protein
MKFYVTLWAAQVVSNQTFNAKNTLILCNSLGSADSIKPNIQLKKYINFM